MSWARILGVLLPALVVIVGLEFARHESFLLFHSLAEIFSIVIAVAIFILAWNSQDFVENYYLLWVGVAYLFIASVDLMHLLTFEGMGAIPNLSVDPPTQLWICARYMQALSLVLAPLFIRRKPNLRWIFAGFSAVLALVFLSIFHWKNFPACYLSGNVVYHLTTFKRVSEYLICGLFLLAIYLLWRRREAFERQVWQWLTASLVVTIISELCFTLYKNSYQLPNALGHYFKILAFFLIYKALVETGFRKPYGLLLRELKQREDTLRESEARYRGLFELSPDAIYVRHGYLIWYINPAGAQFFGLASPEEALGRNILDFTAASSQEFVKQRTEQAEATGQAVAWAEAKTRQADGTEIDVEYSAVPILDQGESALLVIARDITRRKQNEARLQELNQHLEEMVAERTSEVEQSAMQLRVLALEMTQLEQRERRRLAQVLHDHVQQLLAAARLRLQLALQEGSSAAARHEVATADALLTEAIAASRSLTAELSPPVLYEHGLGAALEWLGEQMESRHGLVVEVTTDLDSAAAGEEVSELLFIGARELLFNVVKHAGVPGAAVTLRHWDGHVELSVSDQGAGMDPSALAPGRHAEGGFGLFSLRTRLEALGGRIEVQSSPGHGTRVTLRVSRPDLA